MSNEATRQFKKQIPKNAVLAVLSFITYTLSAIWLTPYLIKHLGPAAFGLVPLAALFTQYATIITGEISDSVNRFLTIEIQRLKGNPNRIFNSAFALYLALILLQVPLFASGIIYADRIFSIPEELRIDAMLLLGFSAASFLVSLLGAVFGVSLFAANRLDIGNGMTIARLAARLGLIILMFTLYGPQLRFIGFIDFGLQLIFFGITVFYWRKLTPNLSISFLEIERKVLKPVFKMSLWSLVNRLGSLMYERSDLWIINRFISPIAAGQYAAILVIANFIRQLSAQVSAQLAPTIMNCWAKDDKVSLIRLLSFSIKVLAFGLTILAGQLILNGKTVLNIWLGEEFVPLFMLLVVFVVHLPINSGIVPLFSLNKASNSVRLPALVSLGLGIVNIVASYYFGVVQDMGMMGVAVATAVVLILKNALFTPIYASCILELPKHSFIAPLLSSIPMFGLVYILSFVPVSEWLHLSSGGKFAVFAEGTFVCLLCGAMVWFFIITRSEKSTIISMIPASIRKVLFRFAQ